MAGPFNIVAQLQLQAPTNLQSVVGQIQRELSGITATVNVQLNSNATQAIQQLNAQLAALQTNLQATQSQAQNTTQAVNSVGSATANMGQRAAQANAQLASTVPSMAAVTSAAKQSADAMENFGLQAGLAARRYSAFLIAGGAIVSFVNALRNGFEEAMQFNREMVRLSQIGNTTASDLRDLESQITKLSTSWGVSSRELVEASIQLRQAGLTAQDTTVSLGALSKAALSPSFGNMKDTTEGLIASMNQFKLTANDAEKTLGAINAVSTRYAVSSEDIIDAIRRTGGAFHAAGGNLNELIGLFGAVRSTSRESSESIGSALRTIFVRMQRGSVVEDLRQLGVELRYTRDEATRMGQVNLTDQFVGPYEALRRLSSALKDVRSTDPRYAAIAEELGGYRQISKIIPLMQEFGKAQDIYSSAQEGANSTTKSAEEAQQAFLVKISKVKEEFSALIRTITESKGFSVFLDMVLQLASALTKLASILTPLIPLLGAMAMFKMARGAGQFAAGLVGGLSGQSPHFGMAGGGLVPGVGDGDTVPAKLTPGEFVIRKQSAQAIGYDKLEHINRYADGGPVDKKKIYGRSFNVGYKDSIGLLARTGQTGEYDDYIDPATISRRGKYPPAIQSYVDSIKEQGVPDSAIPNFLKVRGKVQRSVLNESRYKEFENSVVKVIKGNADDIFRGLPPLKGEALPELSNQALSTIVGPLFESYITRLTGHPSTGPNENFDYTGVGDKQRKTFNKLFTPQVISPWLDAKSTSTASSSKDVIKKGLNEGLYTTGAFLPSGFKINVKPLQKYASGGAVRGYAEGNMVLPENEAEPKFGLLSKDYPERGAYLKLSAAEIESIRTGEAKDFKGFAAYQTMHPDFIGSAGQGVRPIRTLASPDNPPALATGPNLLHIPTGGDSLFMLTHASIGSTGVKTVGPITPKQAGASETVQKYLTQKGVKDVTGNVNVYTISQSAKDEFSEEFQKPISDAIKGTFQAKFKSRAGSSVDFGLSSQQTSSIMGHLFEKYIGGLFNVGTAGSNQYFDYTHGFSADSPGLNKLLYPNGPVKGNLGDAKLSFSDVNLKGMAGKWLGYRQDTGMYAKGGQVDTVPALLTPGEYVINKQAAQNIGYGALEYMNHTGVARFATGGPVKMQNGGRPPGEYAANEVVPAAQAAGLDTRQIIELLNQLRQMGVGLGSVNKALLEFYEGEVKVIGVRKQLQQETPEFQAHNDATLKRRDRAGLAAAAQEANRRRGWRGLEEPGAVPEMQGRHMNPVLPEITPRYSVLDAGIAGARYKDAVNSTIATAGGVFGADKGGQLSAATVDEIKGKELSNLAQQMFKERQEELKTMQGIKSTLEARRIAEKEVTEVLTQMLAAEQQELIADMEASQAAEQKAVAETRAAELAQSAVGTTPAGGIGAGAAAATGGGWKGAVQQYAPMAISMASMYGAQALEAMAGTPEDAAKGHNDTGYTTEKTLAGALQGGAMGAAMGSMFGPVGTIIGGLGGAAMGATQAFLQASKDLEEARTKIQHSDISTALSDAIKTHKSLDDKSLQTQFDTEKGWKTKETADIDARQGSLFGQIIGDFNKNVRGVDDEANMRNEYQDKIRAHASENTQLFSQNLARFTREQMTSNPNISQEEIESRFNKQYSSKINTAFGDEYVKYRPQILEAGRAERRQAEDEKSQSNIGMMVRNFDTLNQALRNATSGLANLARATAVSEDLYKGSVSAMQVRNPAENLGEIGGPNPGNFLQGLHEIAEPFGQRGQALEQAGVATDAVRRQLIASLSVARPADKLAEGDTQAESFASSWIENARAGLKQQGIGGKDVDTILRSVQTQVGKQDFQEVSKDIQLNAGGFVDKSLQPATEPLQKATEEAGKLLQQAGQAFANASARFQQQLMELGNMADQTARIEQEGITIRSRGEAALTHTTGMMAFTLPLEQQQHAWRHHQERLAGDAGLFGDDAYDTDAISARRRNAQDEARGLHQKIDSGAFGAGPLGARGEQWKAATDRLAELERISAELGQAQENLTHITEASAGIQERLNALQKEEEGRRSLAEKWLTGDARGRSEMMRGQQLANAVANGANIDSFGLQNRKLALQTLHEEANVRFANGLTGQDVLEKALGNINVPGVGPANQTIEERRNLQNQLNQNADRGAAANRNLTEEARRQAGAQRQNSDVTIAQIGPELNKNLVALDATVKKLADAIDALAKIPIHPGATPAAPEHKAAGGSIFRPHGTDTVPAMLTPGEYVINRDSAIANKALLERINKARGSVYLAAGGDVAFAGDLEKNPWKGFAVGGWDALQFGHKRRNPLGGISKDFKDDGKGNITQDAMDAGTKHIAERYKGSEAALLDAASKNFSKTHDWAKASQAAIRQGEDVMHKDFGRASLAATIASGAAKVHIGQTAPGLADQYRWEGSTRKRLGADKEALASTGNALDVMMANQTAEVHKGQERADFTGFFARQRVGMGAGNLNMAAGDPHIGIGGVLGSRHGQMHLAAQQVVVNQDGAIIGKLLPGSSLLIRDNGLITKMGKMLDDGTWDGKIHRGPQFVWLDDLMKSGRVVDMNEKGADGGPAHPNWRIKKFAHGGIVPGTGMTDTTAALLTAGEFIINARAAKNIGYENLQRFNKGGEVGYYQGGGNVAPPSAVSATPAAGTGNFTQDIGKLQSAFASFSTTVTNLANVLTKLPPSIQLTGNHNVNVNINGGEAFRDLSKTMQDMITKHVNSAINNFIGQRFNGEVAQMTPAETPKPIDVPTGKA